jgi:hypothetical protein
MKVKIHKKKMGTGGPINNIANPIPYPSLFNINPFGLISTNKTNTSDDSITTTLTPIDEDVANVEAEKGEMLIKGDMTGLYKIAGKKHSQGGTPLNIQQGAFIFSDDKSLAFTKQEKNVFNFKKSHDTKSNNTPAKVLRREVDPEHYNKMVTILQDAKSNDIAKQTAAMMVQKHQEKIGQVALLQEAKKVRSTIPPFAQGPTTLSMDQHDAAEQTAEKMYAALGGFIPKMDEGGYPPDKTGKWGYDNRRSRNPRTGVTSNNWNAMTNYNTPQDYARAVGYTGKLDPQDPNSIRSLQQYVMKQYPDIVNKYHAPSQYGMPVAGRPDDGKLGVRWDAIGQEIQRQKPGVPLAPIGATPGNPIIAPPIKSSVVAGPPITQDQWQGFKFGMNAQEKLTTAAPFLTALSQKPYYDMLQQRYTPNIRLDRMDPTQEAANIQQSSSLAQREAAQNLPGRQANAQGASIQSRTTGALDNLFHQINERNSQIGNQETQINAQNRAGDVAFNQGQLQQVYRNNLLTQQRRDEQLANGASASLNNGIAIQNRLDAMGSAATASALPYVTGAKDSSGNPLYTRDAQGQLHQQMGVPIGFGANRNPVYNPTFGGLDSVGINQSTQNMAGRNFNTLLMGQINDALNDKSVEGTKRLYTLLLGLDRTNRPNTKGDTPLEEINQAARNAYYGR